jgi:hypothetical protein
MPRVFDVIRGKLALAYHAMRGYTLLLALDTRKRKQFTVVGVCSFLQKEMGKNIGFATYQVLLKARLVVVQGRAEGQGMRSMCRVIRRPVTALPRDYSPKQPGHTRRSHQKRRSRRVVVDDAGAILHHRPKRRSTPQPLTDDQRLIKLLLDFAGF